MKFLKKFYLIPLAIILIIGIGYLTVLGFRNEITIPSLITIGDLQFRIYGIILIISILTSVGVLERLFKRAEENDKNLKKIFEKFDIYEALLWAVIPGIVFARIIYFFSNLESYENILDIVKVWQGGMSIFGAVFGGMGGILVYLKKAKLPVFPIVDLVAITIPLGHAVGRWANFVNQEIYGPPTNLPWKMYIAPVNRIGIPSEYVSSDYFHPLFLYEFFLNLMLFVFLFLIFRKGKKMFDGFYVACYALGYGVIRFFMEFLRFDPKTVFGLSIAQCISLVMIIVSSAFLFDKFRTKESK